MAHRGVATVRIRCLGFVVVWITLFSPSFSFADEARWTILASESTFGFRVDVQGNELTGSFTRFEGSVLLNPDGFDPRGA